MKQGETRKLKVSKNETLTISSKKGFIIVKSNRYKGCDQIPLKDDKTLTISQILSITRYSKW